MIYKAFIQSVTLWWRHFAAISLVLVLTGMCASTVNAMTYSVPYTVASGNPPLLAGMIVVLEKEGVVRPARYTEGKSVIGAVASLPPGVLTTDKVGVASAGVLSVLVSDLGGPIKKGDRISLSAIEGVGMKARTTGWIVGIAQADFTPTARTPTQEVTTPGGTSVKAAIQEIPLLLSVSYYTGSDGTGVLGALQQTAQVVAGHEVSAERAVAAFIIFSVAVILLVTFVFGSVKYSLISIGRNPLANGKIARSLIHVLLATFGVIVVTLLVIYFILH